ncbi:MAG: FN3 domain-containing metallophosphoesterase family protein [Prolixibacteraceae bacterium]
MKRLIFILAFTTLSFLNAFPQEDPFRITHGPYLQDMCEDGVTIMWTTNKNGIAWVELAPNDSSHFYLTERPKYFSAPHGFKKVSAVHAVRLVNLKPGTTYRYRIYSQEVLSHSGTLVNYGRVAASSVYRTRPLTFTTNSRVKEDVSFLILNDIHGNNELMTNLLKNTSLSKTDLVFFNGDMVSDIISEDQLFAGFADTSVKLFAREIPVYYARGNHETRGNFAYRFADYFPGINGKLYGLFRQGPVCFVVLDCGEDKPDSDIEYSGIVAFDAYRTQQAEWLKEALQTALFREAPYKVVVVHMPPFGGWHGEKEIEQKFLPLLNNAGVDVMFCGHLHRYIKKEAKGEQGFPVIVNANNSVVKATAGEEELDIQIVSDQGRLIDSLSIPRKKQGR